MIPSIAGPGSRYGKRTRSTSAGSRDVPAKWPTDRGGAGSSEPGVSATPDAVSSGASSPRR
jgi:hypothetical protein